MHEDAKPALLELVRAVLELLPDGWTSALLTVKTTTHADGTSGDEHKIVNEQGRRELVTPDDAVFAATLRLSEIFRKYDEPFEGIQLRVAWSEADEKWGYTIDFDYSDDVKARIAAKNRT